MAADASIYGQVGRFKSFNDYENEANTAEANKLAVMLHRQQYAQGEQAVADQNALRDAYRQFGTNPTDNANALFSRGLGAQGLAYQKSQLEAGKTAAETKQANSHAGAFDAEAASKQLGDKIKAHDFHVQLLGSVQSPDQVPAWIDAGVKSGVFTPEQGQAGLQRFQQAVAQPGGFEAWRQASLQGGMSATDQLKQQQELLIANNNQAGQDRRNDATNATHVKTTSMNNAVTMRGQNMTDARTRESNDAALTKPFEVTGPDQTPQLVQMDKTSGKLVPVPGFGPKAGSAKPLTDSQGKALGFGARMAESDKILSGLEAQGVKTPSLIKTAVESVPGVGGALGMAANAMGVASPEQQQVEQAQRDFVNAVLRRESGAAISQSEFDNARKQYFAQPGDSPQVLTQKAANRRLAQQGVMAEVPVGQRTSIGPAAPAAPAGWKVIR